MDWLKKITENSIPKTELLDFDGESIMKQEAETKAQPYKTNVLLEDLLKSQTPKWINVLMLILVAITLGVSIWALLNSYGII